MSFNLPDYIIVFLICSFVPLAAGILGILYSNMREKEFIPSPEYLAWQTTAAKIGLNEEETLHYNKIVAEKSRWSIVGNYRSARAYRSGRKIR